MIKLYIITALLIAISAVFDRKKTLKGIKTGAKKFMKILPNYLSLLILIAVVLFYSEQFITKYLGQENTLLGMATGVVLGSVTMMPGFISYPLAGVLVSKGVSYAVVSSFVTTLMMVGVLTYPLEREYMGTRATLIRNSASLFIAVIISIAVAFYYGEM